MSNLSDPIADFLARLRNAAQAHRGDVSVPYSRMKEEIARILKQEGYISEFEVDTQSKPAQIKVTMKFVNRTPALTGLKRMSKPGLRKYVGSDDIPRVWQFFRRQGGLLPAARLAKSVLAVNCWLLFGKEVWVCRVLAKNRSKFLKR